MTSYKTSSLLLKQEDRNFSAVLVPENPVRNTSQRGNLTGSLRKIRDCAADLYNQIQEWNNLCINGSDVLLKINSAKSSCQEQLEEFLDESYPKNLQDLCYQLGIIHLQMTKCVEKMLISNTEISGVIKLELLRSATPSPMFLSWTAQLFGDIWTDITSAYEKELTLKTYIKENIAHIPEEDTRMFYVTAWVNEPYISNSVNTAVESLLKETGHR